MCPSNTGLSDRCSCRWNELFYRYEVTGVRMKKIWTDPSLRSSDITPEDVYRNRRQFLKWGAAALSGTVLAACGVQMPTSQPDQPEAVIVPPIEGEFADELGDSATSFKDITHYNNFYEFSLGKEQVAGAATKLTTRPWQVQVDGMVRNPKTYDLEDILSSFPREERVYRLRCVEGWSMVIPWLGFPLADLLKEVEPTGDARFVKFVTLMRPAEMPNQQDPSYPWPYTEGLRLDEAMHDLTIISTGLYGRELLNQNGAPLRLVVPWKYGFKSIKSIVKIELTDEQPETLWSSIAPQEYGFYSNVNPNKPHPRWDQSSERRIGETRRRKTLMFNGYEKEVAGLYAGMDLIQNY
jgi:sulfoxide reductase catalytic subunit YedY